MAAERIDERRRALWNLQLTTLEEDNDDSQQDAAQINEIETEATGGEEVRDLSGEDDVTKTG